MYGRPQQAYPRPYGNAYTPQQPQYGAPARPPQQQPSYGPQGHYPPHGQHPPQGQYPPHGHGHYAPRQASPPHQQPQLQQAPPRPSYGAGPAVFGGGATPARGAYGHPTAQAAPPSMPAARGSLPYGRGPAPAAVSSYESQAQKWKKGFSVAPTSSGGSGAGGSRQSDIEAPLIAELCSSAGSSYPPRDVLQKLLRHLPSLDHQYVCELLDDKLDDRVWQVQGKALSVLDALFKSQEAEFYKNHYYHRIHVLEALSNSRKELLKARAEKVFNVIKSHVPPSPPSPVQQPTHQPDAAPPASSLLPQSPSAVPSAPRHEVNLLGSPMLMAQDEPANGPPSSAFGFLNSTIGGAATPPPPAADADAAPASAFSFLAAQPSTQPAPEHPITRVVAVTPVAAAQPAVAIFSSLPPPTPVVGLITPVEEPEPAAPVEEEPNIHDPIHDAFEGLSFGDDEDNDGDKAGNGNRENPLEGFSTASSGSTGMAPPPVIKVDPKDPVREIILEMDVPAGPMGLMLDRSIPHMAVVQGFLRMPTGERGYLELHPVLCPGCALVSINSVNVEDKGLDEVGAILGSLMHSGKVLRFKKLMRGGRTVNPADPDVVYTPPPPEKVETPPADAAEHDGDASDDDGEDHIDAGGRREFIERLTGYANQLDAIERQLDELVQRDRANAPVVDLKNQLAQLHGNVEKIQTQGIDAVILGANPPANADEIRQLRSWLVRRADELTKRIQKVAVNGTAPSPLVAPVTAVGSPEVSAFSFVGGANGLPATPPLQLPVQATAAPMPAPPASSSSGFSFLQASASPVSSPRGAAPTGSAFSFLAAGGAAEPASQPQPLQPQPPVPAPTPTPTASLGGVFAGLSVRGSEPNEEAPSAFGFLSGAANAAAAAATPVGVVEPPRVTSPTAFSFLRASGPPSSPPSSPRASGPAGSAFSFIS